MRRGEKVTNQYRYQVKCQEHIFEKYLDDMGVLVVDFFDTQKNQVVGTSKIMMKLYIKRYGLPQQTFHVYPSFQSL